MRNQDNVVPGTPLGLNTSPGPHRRCTRGLEAAQETCDPPILLSLPDTMTKAKLESKYLNHMRSPASQEFPDRLLHGE